jgi:hypothetical protein
MAMSLGKFKIICDRCGAMFDGAPAADYPPFEMAPNRVTVATVEYCPMCVLQSWPVSHRTLFLCNVVKELEDLKRKNRNG